MSLVEQVSAPVVIAPREPNGPGVYYLKLRIAEAPIKIGRTCNLVNRIRHLQTGLPFALEVLAFWPTGPVETLRKSALEHERRMHARFASEHIRGEWFRPSADLLEHIASVNRLFPMKGRTP